MNKPATEQKTPPTFEGWWSQFESSIRDALTKGASLDRFKACVLVSLRKSPELKECTTESLRVAMMNIARLGLAPDGDNAHMIPRKNKQKGTNKWALEAQGLIDYKGLVRTLLRSKTVKSMTARITYANDRLWQKDDQYWHECDDPAGARGAKTGVIVAAQLPNGERVSDWMSTEELAKVKACSKSAELGYGPWISWPEEMEKKSVARRMCKWLDLNPEQADAIQALERQEFADLLDRPANVGRHRTTFEGDFTPAEALKQRLAEQHDQGPVPAEPTPEEQAEIEAAEREEAGR